MRVDPAPPPELYPFQSRWAEFDGIRLHYVDEGSGAPIVMCHGNPTWSFLYREVILGLRDRFRCIAMDHPGFGLSDRPERYGYTPQEHAALVGRLVDQLGLDGFIVMGQDWGGPIALKVAVDRKARVAGGVFMNTWYWPADLSFTIFSLIMSTPPMQARILDRNFFVETIMPNSVARPLEPAVMDTYRRAQPNREARRGAAEFPRQIRKARPLLAELERRVPAVLGGKPVALVWGMRDRGFGHRRIVDRWKRDLPQADVTILRNASHYVQEDAPDEIAAAVVRRFA